MTNNQYIPPLQDELEISVFGPGYGEAILIHFGEKKWLLVDSCLDPKSNQPASLKYLNDLKIEVEQAVKLIVATHWHDDHVRGISHLFEKCQSAQFVISNALKQKDFLTLTSLYRKPSAIETGINEFARIFQTLEARKGYGIRVNPPISAVANRVLFFEKIQTISELVEVKVSALSPSDASILQAELAFAEMLEKEEKSRKRFASLQPNHTSVVLLVEIGSNKILLGADLEVTSDPKRGWSAILNESTVISGKSSLFKIPHHGSKNAHYDEVWSELLLSNPFTVVSPFRKGRKKLPTPLDIQRLISLTPYAYATSPTNTRKMKWRDRVVKEYVEQMTQTIYPVHHGWGHVRFRKKINEPHDSWKVELFGDAYTLSDNLL